MTALRRRNLPAASAALALLVSLQACTGDSAASDASDVDEQRDDAEAEHEDEEVRVARPMPHLDDRIDAVLGELGEEGDAVREAATRLRTTSTREQLARLSPRTRAALRRHNVRLEQVARRATGGAR